MGRQRMLAAALAGASAGAFTLVALALAAHVPLAHGLTHTVGVFVTLAELLRAGIFYPATQDPQLVYTTLYHPLAFAPLALLPGHGIEIVRGLRVLVGCELLSCLALVAWLARRAGLRGVLAWQPALWACCTLPVTFSLLGMRDDPRAALCALAALVAFARRGRHAAPWASAFLVLTFFVKATVPFAPGLAIVYGTWRRDRGECRRFLVTTALGTAAGIAFLQWGLGADFLHNGLWYAVVEPAQASRSLGATLAALARDLAFSWDGWRDLALPLLLLLSCTRLWLQLRRHTLDAWDVLMLATWLETLLIYRSPGTDLNHLLDLALFAAVHAAFLLRAILTPRRALLALALLLALGQPWRLLLPPEHPTPLENAPAAQTAQALRSLEPVPTLCEEPLVAWLAGLRPLVTDPFLTFAALQRYPEIRRIWFGPAQHPLALQRIVLMRNPFAPGAEHWYGKLHFDAAFVAELRAHWRIVVTTPNATVLARK